MRGSSLVSAHAIASVALLAAGAAGAALQAHHTQLLERYERAGGAAGFRKTLEHIEGRSAADQALMRYQPSTGNILGAVAIEAHRARKQHSLALPR